MTDDFQARIDRVPYARTLGIQMINEDGCFLLPSRKSNIGNPTLPALHGGAIAGFMELSAMIHVLSQGGSDSTPKIVDFAVDFVRAGKFEETFCRCELVFFGRKMINVSITAWQDDPGRPIAKARAQFLVKD